MWNFNLLRLYRRKQGDGFYFLICEVERLQARTHYTHWALFSIDHQRWGTRFYFFVAE